MTTNAKALKSTYAGEVIFMDDYKAVRKRKVMKSLLNELKEYADSRQESMKTLGTDELRERFRERSANPGSMVWRLDVRPGVVVGMTAEESLRYDSGVEAEIIPFKKK